LLCFSSFLFFASFNMLIPEIPAFLESMGGKQYLGLVIPLFTLTAGLSRPFSGKLADTVGRIPVMVVGAAVSAICGLLYAFVGTVWAFLLLRFLHGFSTGFKPTGTSAYVADIVPAKRRGEAMGVLGMAGSTGMAVGPSLGSYLAQAFTLHTTFYTGSAFALASVLILLGMKESLTAPERFKQKHLRLRKDDFYEPKVLPAGIVMLLCVFGFGVMLTLIPDYSVWLNLPNKGLFFTTVTLASLSVRFLAGRASDRYGRVVIMRIATTGIMVGMALIALAQSAAMLLVAGAVYGMAVGITTPTLYAWTIDLGNPERRGRAMATIYIMLEIGIGLGGLVGGFLYGNVAERLPYPFWISSATAAIALVYLVLGVKRKAHLSMQNQQA